MSLRPQVVPLWAFNAGGGAISQPPTGTREGGFATNELPPAQWFNWQWNLSGAWINFLRSASLSNWSPDSIPYSVGALTIAHSTPSIDADTTTLEGATPVRRLVVAGEDGGGKCLFVSHRGGLWSRRTNFPAFTGYFRRVYYIPTTPTGRWFLLGYDPAVGTLLHTTANSAVLGGTGTWSAAALPGGTVGLRALAYDAASGAYALVSNSAIIASLDGTTWANATLAGAPAGLFTDVVWNGTLFLAVTSAGETYVAGGGASAAGVWGTVTALPPGAGAWRLSVGPEGLLVAWRESTGATLSFYTSADNGNTWTEVASSPSVERVNQLVYRDNVWVASTTEAPFLWQSNDLAQWVRLPLPYFDGDVGLVFDVTYSEGAWYALRDAYVLVSKRAEDLSPGAWTPDPTASALHDAAYLRGRRIATTPPTDGQGLRWDATAQEWEPATISGGSMPIAAAANEVPLSTGPGSAYTARSLAELRALLLGPFVDPRTGAGWSAAPSTGGASATWADNKLLLDCDVASAGSCGTKSTTRLPSTDAYDFAIRLRVDLGDGNGNGRVLLALGRDSANCLVLTFGANGALQAGRTYGGVYTSYTLLLAVAELDAAARTGGQLWVRAARSAQGFAWLWGIGAGGQLPTAWEEYWSSVPLCASSGYNFVQRAHALSQGPFVGVYGATVGALDFEVTVLDLVAGLPGAFGGA